jgi:hypothetical protein
MITRAISIIKKTALEQNVQELKRVFVEFEDDVEMLAGLSIPPVSGRVDNVEEEIGSVEDKIDSFFTFISSESCPRLPVPD